MKNIKIRKFLIIGLTVFLIVSSHSLTASAVHSGGNTLYTAPLRFNFQVDGIAADLTPSLLYTSGTQYSIVNDETALLPNDAGDVSVHRGRIDITSVSTYNSAIDCAYKLSFDTANSYDEFTLTITAAAGFYNFQKYTVPKIAVPTGYTASVRISYDVEKTSFINSTDVPHREFNLTSSYLMGDVIPLLYNYVLVNNIEESLDGNVFISDYETTITFTPTSTSGELPAGWYRWDNFPDTDFGFIDSAEPNSMFVVDCGLMGNQVYTATVNNDFTLSYRPVQKIGIYFGDWSIGDYEEIMLEYLQGDSWDIIYDFYSEQWYVPEEDAQSGDGVITGITPITIKYLDFRQPVDVCTDAPDWFYDWFVRNTTYTPNNPIVTGYITLIGSEWYLRDTIDFSKVVDFFENNSGYFPNASMTGVFIPFNFSTSDPLTNDVGTDSRSSFDGFFLDMSYDEDDVPYKVFAYVTNGGMTAEWYDYYAFSTDINEDEERRIDYITLSSAPSPLAYEFINIAFLLERLVDSNSSLPTTFSFTDGDTSIDVQYCLDNESVVSAQYGSTLSDFYTSAYRRGIANGNGEFSGDYGSWLATAVGGFMSFEIFPNFSIGGILGVCVAVGLLMMFLKFFAGG